MKIPCFLKRFWAGWMEFSHAAGDFQARWILLVFYWIIAAPFGAALRLFADPLQTRRGSPSSGAKSPKFPSDSNLSPASSWSHRTPDETTLERARKLF